MKTSSYSFRRNKGNVLIMTALSLLVIIGMAGLAIDSADSFSNLTRLQTSTDAAALAAAQKLLAEVRANIGKPVTVGTAVTAGRAVYQSNLNEFGTGWLPNTTSADVQFCFSRNLQDFSNCLETINWKPNADDQGFFVKASVASTSLPNILMQAVGLGPTRSISAMSVAGTICPGLDCGLAPFFVCDNSVGETDDNCSDGFCFGNPVTRVDGATPDPAVDPTHFFTLKVNNSSPPATPAPTATVCDPTTPFETQGCYLLKDQRAVDDTSTPYDETDPNGFPVAINRSSWEFNKNITLNGNFGYLDLLNAEGEAGDSGVPQMFKDLLSGNACLTSLNSDGAAQTQTGTVASLDQAFNALLGMPGAMYNNPHAMPLPIDQYADFVGRPTPTTTTPEIYWRPISFNFYKRLYDSHPTWTNGSNKFHSRLRPVPVIKCPTTLSGNQTGLEVKGYACFFFNRRMHSAANTPEEVDGRLPDKSQEDWVIAEHVDNKFCPVDGVRSTPCAKTDPKNANIILFQVVGSKNS